MTDMLRVRATITGQEGGLGLATFYFNGAGTATAAQALEGANRVRAYFGSLATRISTVISVQVQPQVDVITAESGVLSTSFVVASPTVLVGSDATQILPGATQGLLRLNTGAFLAGRRVQGRSFIPGPCTSVNTGLGVPSTAYITSVGTAGALLNTQIATALSSVTWHRPRSHSGGSIVLNTSFSGATKWSVLRSRRD